MYEGYYTCRIEAHINQFIDFTLLAIKRRNKIEPPILCKDELDFEDTHKGFKNFLYIYKNEVIGVQNRNRLAYLDLIPEEADRLLEICGARKFTHRITCQVKWVYRDKWVYKL